MDASLIALLFLILFLAFTGFLVSRLSPAAKLDKSYFQKHWQQIQSMEGMSAIISADKLLDEALKRSGARGDTMADRMKDYRSRFSHNDSVWSAHKLRNRVVHEPDAKLRPSDERKALRSFRQALKDLGAL